VSARVLMSRSAGSTGPGVSPSPQVAAQRPALPPIPLEWKGDQQKLVDELYADIVGLLKNDADSKVRHEALLAAGQLQYTVGAGRAKLPPFFVALLVERFRHESDMAVRAEIVKTFRLIPTDSADAEARAVLRDGLVDPQKSVRFEALSALLPQSNPGGNRLTFADARDVVVPALKSPDAGVRLGAVQALNYFGKAARDYIAILQTMSERDSNEQVRESAGLAIAAIRRDGG